MSLLSRTLDRWCERQKQRGLYTPLVDSTETIHIERFYPLWRDEYWDKDTFKLNGGHPWWAPFNVFLHKWHGSDSGRPHNHPRWNMTLVLSGGLVEVCGRRVYRHGPGSVVVRSPYSFHKLFLPPWAKGETYTLFFVGRRSYTQQLLMQDGRQRNWYPFDSWVDGEPYKEAKPEPEKVAPTSDGPAQVQPTV